jgi:hypothetical protein
MDFLSAVLRINYPKVTFLENFECKNRQIPFLVAVNFGVQTRISTNVPMVSEGGAFNRNFQMKSYIFCQSKCNIKPKNRHFCLPCVSTRKFSKCLFSEWSSCLIFKLFHLRFPSSRFRFQFHM